METISGERNAVGRDELLDSTPLATHTQGPFEHTTFLTQLSTPTAYIVANSATNEQAQPSSSVFRAVNEATSSQSGEQLDYSKAQLVVAILALVGVGKVFESLGKVVWKKCKKVVFRTSQQPRTSEETDGSFVEPAPFVNEHPAGTPRGTIPEEELQDFVAFTQTGLWTDDN